MKKYIILIFVLFIVYTGQSQNDFAIKSVIKTSFIEGDDCDSLIIDFANINVGDLKHAVIEINSPNGLSENEMPNSKSFINNEYRTLISFYPSKTNPLASRRKRDIPYRFSNTWNDTLETHQIQPFYKRPFEKSAKPFAYKSFYFNVVLFITPYYNGYIDTLPYTYNVKFGSRNCILLIKAIVHYGSYSRDLTWNENGIFKTKFVQNVYGNTLVFPPRIHIDDYNRDGYLDTLIVNISSRNYPKTYKNGVKLISGVSNNSFYLHYPYFDDKEGSFSSFIKLDDELCAEENRPFRELMRDSSFSTKNQEVEPVFEYYLRMHHKSSKVGETTNHQVDSPFYAPIVVSPIWYYLPMKLPSSQYIWIEFDSTNIFGDYKVNDKGWMFYYASYHLRSYNIMERDEELKGFKFVAQNKKYKIYRTNHGVVVQKGDKYAWIFHGYGGLRLRHASVGNVKLYKNYIICSVQTHGWDFHSVMVNLETGEQRSLFYGIKLEPDNPKFMRPLIRAFEK